MSRDTPMPTIIPKGIPFAQIPHALIEDTNLSHSAVRVYCYLMRRANDEGRAWPGIRRIATETAMGRNTAKRSIEALVTTGWLEVERRYDPEMGRHETNRYLIHAIRVGVGPPRTQGVPDTDPPPGSTTDTELHPLSTTSNELQVAATPRDEIKTTLVEIFGEPPGNGWSLYNRVATHILNQGGTAADIPGRAASIAAEWGTKATTVASLEKYWTRYKAQIGFITDRDVEAFVTEQRRAARVERLENDT